MSSSRCRLLLVLCSTAASLAAQDRRPELDPAMAQIATAYAAKVTASAVFVSGRTLESVWAEELAPETPLDLMMAQFLRIDIDREGRSVTCTLGKATATAVATRGLGCTLVTGDVGADALRQRAIPEAAPRPDPATRDWPLGDRVTPTLDATLDAALAAALDGAFGQPELDPPRRTRAVVIVHRGQLVAERYGEGYTATTLLPGWSMTKTLVDALVGIRVRQGALDLDAPLEVAEWPKGDPRRALRLPDLLSMTSGLEWFESYKEPTSDVLRMLFTTADHGAVQAQKPRRSAPGSTFAYSSGTTNLICRLLRSSFDNDAEYWAFPQQQLFSKLGMHRAVIETDPSGTFVGSSYGFATARDWARIGMLYALDGTLAGTRILPEGWVARSAKPVAASDGRYGSQIWLNVDPDGDGPAKPRWPELPGNLMRLDGHEGQHVIVLPTEQIVVARLGCTKTGNAGVRALVNAVVAACAAK